jgi:mono/diheme cytochrome c family protein
MPLPTDATAAAPQRKQHGTAISTVLLALLLIVGAPSLVVQARSLRQKPGPVAAAIGATPEALLAGERIYQRNCAGCHQAKGQGKLGQYPPLVGSDWLVEDKATSIRVVLLGMRGPVEVEGQKYDNVMPNFGVNLPDADIAQVLTFARSSWGNHGGPVTADEVAKVRTSLAGRNDPWNGGAELGEARKNRVLR